MGGIISNAITSRATALYGLSVDSPESPQEGAAAKDGAQKSGKTPPPTAELERLMHAAAARVGTLVSASELHVLRTLVGTKRQDIQTALIDVERSADEAAKAMDEVRKLTGREIVEAFSKNTQVAKRNKVQIQSLFNSLADVSEKLRRIYNRLPEDFPEIERQTIEDLLLKNDMRHSEFGSFVCQAQAIASEPSESLSSEDKNVQTQMMEGTFGKLTKGMAAGMHGNLEAVAQSLGTDGSEAKKALGEVIDAKREFMTGNGASTDQVASGLKKLSKAVNGLGTEPGLYGGFMSAFATHIDEVGGRLDATSSAVKHVFEEIVDNSPVLRMLDNPKWMERINANNLTCLRQFLNCFKRPLDYLRRYAAADGHMSYNELVESLNSVSDDIEKGWSNIDWTQLCDDLARCIVSHKESLAFRDACKALCRIFKIFKRPENQKGVEELLKAVKVYPSVFTVGASRIDAIRKNTLETGNLFSKADVLDILNGNLSVADCVEMRLNGGPTKLPDPELCDDNLIEDVVLGSGAMSTVHKLKYLRKDKTVQEVVFKTDQQGTQGLRVSSPGLGAYNTADRATSFNRAVRFLAEQIGCQDLFPGIQPLVHKGRYGIAMDVAKGTPIFDFLQNEVNDGLGVTDIGNLRKSTNISQQQLGEKIVSNLLRQMTDLSWFDLLCGQGDRHRNNYFVHVDPQTGKTCITAIDNDLAFPRYRTGLTKFTFRGESAEKVLAQMNSLNLPHPQRGVKKMMNDDGEQCVEIDVRQVPDAFAQWLRNFKGMHSFGQLPAVMSQDMYEKLSGLDDDAIKEIAKELLKRMSLSSAKATVSRLKELKQLAIQYKQENRVVRDADWAQPRVRQLIRDNAQKGPKYGGTSDYCNRDLGVLLT